MNQLFANIAGDIVVFDFASELGGALGIALLGSIGAHIYLKEMNDGRYGLSKRSTGTFGGDLAYIDSLRDQTDVLANSTRDAFTLGLNWVGGLSAIIALVLSLICFIGFKKKDR